jgi:hypothetical protein
MAWPNFKRTLVTTAQSLQRWRVVVRWQSNCTLAALRHELQRGQARAGRNTDGATIEEVTTSDMSLFLTLAVALFHWRCPGLYWQYLLQRRIDQILLSSCLFAVNAQGFKSKRLCQRNFSGVVTDECRVNFIDDALTQSLHTFATELLEEWSE